MHVHYPILYTYGLCLCIILSLPGPLSRPAPPLLDQYHARTLQLQHRVSQARETVYLHSPIPVVFSERERDSDRKGERKKELRNWIKLYLPRWHGQGARNSILSLYN